MKPYFRDKSINNDNITLVENEETVSDIAETLNNFFSEVVTNLNLSQYDDPTVNFEAIEDPVATVSDLSKRIIVETYNV